jgi:hypothetical protein
MQNLTEEELSQIKEKRKKELQEEKKQRREELIEAEKRRREQSKRAEEAAISLGKKSSEWYTNPYYLTFGGLGALLLYVMVMLFMNRAPPLNKTPVIDEKAIAEHNESSPWSQGASAFWEGATLLDAKKIFTTSFTTHSNLQQCNTDESIAIPDSFDARTEWPDCVAGVVDQNRKCDGSYAIALAQTFSERECIASAERKMKHYSPQELLSCDLGNHGCKGGALNIAIDYMRVSGLTQETCMPYKGTNDVKCDSMCTNPEKVRLGSYCVLIGEEAIKREIMKNGPVVGVTQVYVDFLNYKSGIYKKNDETPKFSGFTAVKIVGWGVEGEGEGNQGEKYWIVQNTWGSDWGENGYARIQEGQQFPFEQYDFALLTQQQLTKAQMEQQQKAKEAEEQAKKEEVVPDMDLDDEKDKE